MTRTHCHQHELLAPFTYVPCRGLAAIGSRSRARLLEDEKFVTLQVGKSVFDGAPRNMRTELWMSSLQRKGIGVAASQKYEDMLLSVSATSVGFCHCSGVLQWVFVHWQAGMAVLN